MHGKGQATRLAELMQHNPKISHYQFALPLVTVSDSQVASLEKDDIFLFELPHLEGVLIEDETVCAKVTVRRHKGRYVLQVEERSSIRLDVEATPLCFICATVRSREISRQKKIELPEGCFEKIDVLYGKQKIADASLVLVDEQIAVKIDKVERR